MLTRASVHCADRIVATTSSNALVRCNAQVASGYSRFRRAMIFFARALRSRAPAAAFVFMGVKRNLLDGASCRDFFIGEQRKETAAEEQQFSCVCNGINAGG